MQPIFLATAAVAALSLAAAAQAQTAAPSWTGGYVGGHVGYGFQSSNDDERVVFDKDLNGNFNDTVTTTAGADAFSPGFCGGRAKGPTPASGCDKDDDGFNFGLRAGYDWQTPSNLVVGGLVEYSSGSVKDGVSAFSTTPASYTFRRELNWSAAARLRAGYAMGSYLGYVTGGVARAGIDRTFTSTNTVNTFVPRDGGKVWGWQLGAGVERRVGVMSVGLEYLYSRYNDDDYTVRSQGPAPATNPFILTNAQGTDLRRTSDKFANHAVRLTAAYRF